MKLKYGIRGALLILICVLSYLTYESVAGPVRYRAEVAVKEEAVIAKLKVLREAQIAYKEENGGFCGNLDTLLDFMENGMMTVVIEYGDKDDSTTVFTSIKTEVSVKDTLFPNVDMATIGLAPGYDTTRFLVQTDIIKKNNVMVPVFQITDPAPFSKERVAKKDPLRVGSIYDVDYIGNWK